MTKKLFIILPLFALIFTSGGKGSATAQNTPTFDEGVVLRNVRWATRNVAAPGIFARSPESTGLHFTWEEAQNACPSGWRLPTAAELFTLKFGSNTWVQRNGVDGRLFGDPPRQIFIPAAGFFDFIGNRYDSVGVLGFYWSSTSVYNNLASANNLALVLRISHREGIVTMSPNTMVHSVRCVAIE